MAGKAKAQAFFKKNWPYLTSALLIVISIILLAVLHGYTDDQWSANMGTAAGVLMSVGVGFFMYGWMRSYQEEAGVAGIAKQGVDMFKQFTGQGEDSEDSEEDEYYD